MHSSQNDCDRSIFDEQIQICINQEWDKDNKKQDKIELKNIRVKNIIKKKIKDN